MVNKVWKKEQVVVAKYDKRCKKRGITLMQATMDMVAYFMGLGDTKEEAESKIGQVSTSVASLLYAYKLGNTQPLIDAINNIDEQEMPFMDDEAKQELINKLTINNE